MVKQDSGDGCHPALEGNSWTSLQNAADGENCRERGQVLKQRVSAGSADATTHLHPLSTMVTATAVLCSCNRPPKWVQLHTEADAHLHKRSVCFSQSLHHAASSFATSRSDHDSQTRTAEGAVVPRLLMLGTVGKAPFRLVGIVYQQLILVQVW